MTTRSRAGVIVSGVLNLVGVLLVLFAVPAALVTLGSGYLPDHVPSSSEVVEFLTTGDQNAAKLLGLGVAAAWLAWASLAISILVEIPAAIRGVPAPKLPGLSWQQGRAAAMTGAIAAMLAVGGAATATAATPTTAPVATTHTSVQASPAQTQAHTSDTDQSAAEHRSTTRDAARGADRSDQDSSSTRVTVQPGDTLWDIAEDELDDGSRYDEIADASKGTSQPGGQRLSDPDLIQPGWTLTVPGQDSSDKAPSPARGATSVTPKSSGADTAPDSSPAHGQEKDASSVPPAGTSTAGAARPSTIPHGSAAPTSTPSTSPQPTTAPSAQNSTTSSPTTAPTTSAAPTAQQDREQGLSASAVLSVFGLGSLGCAGLLGLLLWHRALQQQRRRPGERIAMPSGDAADIEAQMRTASDPIAAADLDNALSSIAAGALAGDHPLPGLRAARMTREAIEVYLVDDTTTLNSPWTSDGPGTWVLDRQSIATLPTQDQMSPWPALVTLGADEDDAHLLINLEEIGTLGLVADAPEVAEEVLNALALELMTSRWGEEAQVILVGVMPDLAEALDTNRVTSATDLDQVLSSLEHTAEVFRGALARDGLTSIAQARVAGVLSEAWSPNIVLTSTPPTSAQRERIAQLVDSDLPQLAIAVVTCGDQPVGEWTLNIAHGDAGEVTATLGPAGITITPQRLPQQVYRAQVDLFTTARTEPRDDTDDLETGDPRLGYDDILSRPRVPSPDVPEPRLPEPAGYASPTSWAIEIAARDQHIVTLDVPAGVSTAMSAHDDQELVTQDVETDHTESEQAETVQAEGHLDEQPVEGSTSSDPSESDVDDSQSDEAAQVDETTDDELDAHPESTAVVETEEPDEADPPVAAVETPSASVTPLPTPALGPMVRLLGPPDIVGIDQPETQARVLEVVAYLALFPGQSSGAFNEAIFPGEHADEKLGGKRNTYMRNARNHLGNGPSGEPYVGLVPKIGYRLSDEISVDWDQLRELVGDDPTRASTEALRAALELVRGQPLSGIKDSRYDWAMSIKTEMCSAVADIAHELSHRAAEDADSRLATWAVEKGLAAEPTNEALWRDAVIAAWQSGVPGRTDAVIRRINDVFDSLGSDVDHETQALINTVIQQERAHA